MALTSGGDAWRISGEERTKHDSQFFLLKPVNGFITGEQAKRFFMQSGLPTPMLGQIWTLADMNNDGKMDKKEFSIAMHLIKKKLQGFELPKALPPSLKADPIPMVGSFSSGGMSQPMGMSMVTGMPMMSGLASTNMVGSSMTMPIVSNGVTSQMGLMGGQTMGIPGVMADNTPRAGSFGPVPVQQSAPAPGGFAIPHNSKLKHTLTFNTNDRHMRGHLTGVEARALLVHTGLHQSILAQIWNLADFDKDGKLTCEEFCIAMHLADLVKAGVILPPKLPVELYPNKGRAGSITGTPPPHQQVQQQQPDAFGDLLGNIGMPPPVVLQPNVSTENVVEDIQPVTFEDKRKENFDKGQAELERRRQMLQEQIRQQEQARMEKERQEQEKRERVRQEQERKRLMELERQMEKQRQIEREKEQQRQKMMEQKEAARRELERQRQMEWERQRKEQLLTEKAREYEQLGAAKSKSCNLKSELESMQGKKTEIGQKIQQVRNGVTDFTSSIESMRITRDNKNAEIERFQNEIKTLDQKFAKLKQDQEFLNVKVQTTIQSNPMAETYRTVLHSVELKKTTLQRSRKELEQTERDTEAKLIEIDNTNTELKNLKIKLVDIQKQLSKTEKQKHEMKSRINIDLQAQKEREEQEEKRKEDAARIAKLALASQLQKPHKPTQQAKQSTNDNAWFDFGSQATTTSKSDDIWSTAFSDITASTTGSSDIWGNAVSSQQKEPVTAQNNQSRTKAKALYQFDARNHDELSLVPGDIILLLADQSAAEAGWLGGEKDGKTGWFPEAYIEEIDSNQISSEYSTPKEVQEIRITSPTPGLGEKAPDGLQAQALYPWKAKKDNHLTFNKGDVIVIKEQQDMWWSGELNGQIGWFPKSYVKLIGGIATNTSQSNSRSETPVVNVSDESRLTPQHNIADSTQLNVDSARSTPQHQLNMDSARSTPATLEPKEGECYVAAYYYSSSEPGDLTFDQNEVIMVTEMDGAWWTGSIGERTGMFPAGYVMKMDIPQETDPSTVRRLLSTRVSSIALSTEGIDFDKGLISPPIGPDTDPTQTPYITSGQNVNGLVEDPFSNTQHNVTGFVDDPFSNTTFDLGPFSTESFKNELTPMSNDTPISDGLDSQVSDSVKVDVEYKNSLSNDTPISDGIDNDHFAGFDESRSTENFNNAPAGFNNDQFTDSTGGVLPVEVNTKINTENLQISTDHDTTGFVTDPFSNSGTFEANFSTGFEKDPFQSLTGNTFQDQDNSFANFDQMSGNGDSVPTPALGSGDTLPTSALGNVDSLPSSALGNVDSLPTPELGSADFNTPPPKAMEKDASNVTPSSPNTDLTNSDKSVQGENIKSKPKKSFLNLFKKSGDRKPAKEKKKKSKNSDKSDTTSVGEQESPVSPTSPTSPTESMESFESPQSPKIEQTPFEAFENTTDSISWDNRVQHHGQQSIISTFQEIPSSTGSANIPIKGDNSLTSQQLNVSTSPENYSNDPFQSFDGNFTIDHIGETQTDNESNRKNSYENTTIWSKKSPTDDTVSFIGDHSNELKNLNDFDGNVFTSGDLSIGDNETTVASKCIFVSDSKSDVVTSSFESKPTSDVFRFNTEEAGLYEEVAPKALPQVQPVDNIQGEEYEDISDLMAGWKKPDTNKEKPAARVPPPRPPPLGDRKKVVRFMEQDKTEKLVVEEELPPIPPDRKGRRRKNSQESERNNSLSEQEDVPPVLPVCREKNVNKPNTNVTENVGIPKEKTDTKPDVVEDIEPPTPKGRKKKKILEKSKSIENLSSVDASKTKSTKKSFWPWKKKTNSDQGEISNSCDDLAPTGMSDCYEEPVPRNMSSSQPIDVGNLYEPVGCQQTPVSSSLHLEPNSSQNPADSSNVYLELPVHLQTSNINTCHTVIEPDGTQTYDEFLGIGGTDSPNLSASKRPIPGVVPPPIEPDGTQTYDEFLGIGGTDSPNLSASKRPIPGVVPPPIEPDGTQAYDEFLEIGGTDSPNLSASKRSIPGVVPPPIEPDGTQTYDEFLEIGGTDSPNLSASKRSIPGVVPPPIEPDGTQTYDEFLEIGGTDSPNLSASKRSIPGVVPPSIEPDSTQTYDEFLGVARTDSPGIDISKKSIKQNDPNMNIDPFNDFQPDLYEDVSKVSSLSDFSASHISASTSEENQSNSSSEIKSFPLDYDYAVNLKKTDSSIKNSSVLVPADKTVNNSSQMFTHEQLTAKDLTAEDDNMYEEVGSPLRKQLGLKGETDDADHVTVRSEEFKAKQTKQFDQTNRQHCQPMFFVDNLKSNEKTQPSQQKTGNIKKPEIASVIAAYSATGPEQLSLQPGQVIQVRKKSSSGWWEGELQARGQKKKVGWFPANYVKLLGGSQSTPDNNSPQGQQDQRLTPTTSAVATSPAITPQPSYIEQVIAVYPYNAQHEDELTFHKDSVINVLNKDDDNWWKGEVNGQIGMFPSNYVEPLTTSPPQENSWSSDPAVLATTSPEEIKRQNYIHELINTEESYMEDMSIVVQAFYMPMKDAKIMTEEELESIFVNWQELILCNTKFSRSLRVRKKLIGNGQVIHVIGDILCENLPHLTPYIRFCSCQLKAAALIQYKTENSPEFKQIQKKCIQNPKTKSMPLSSFLLKPMQRITKYPLMIQKILQYTPEGHPDNQNLKDALTKAEELCSQVNEGVRERENSDKLEWMQNHVHCEGLPEKITFNSVTNCLGPRKILFSGTIYKLKSNKELVAFLCNDFLLFANPLSSSTSKFIFDPKTKTQYKMYKTPIFLNEIMVKRVGDEDSDNCLFQVSHIDRVYTFKTGTNTEKENWLRHLEAASKNYIETERKKREKVHSLEEPNKIVGRMLVIIVEGINLAPSQNVKRSAGVGRLLVLIQEGCDLQSRDANGKSDPYCEVSMGAQEHKTKVIPATINPKWNQNMQFTIRDVDQDVLCITVFDRDLFSPNDFLGRTEIRVKEILHESKGKRGPITKRLLLYEISSGEVVVKLDLQLYDNLNSNE